MNLKRLTGNYYYCSDIRGIVECKEGTSDVSELEEYVSKHRKEYITNNGVFVKPDNWLPTSISLFPSASCSMKCSYCYYCSGNNEEKDLSKEDLQTIIDFLIRNAKVRRMLGDKSEISVTLTGGGEPTFNWDNFTYFVDNLKKKAADNNLVTDIFLVTNGVLSETKIDYLCKNIDQIQISYDGNTYLQNLNRKLVSGKDSAALVEGTMLELSRKKKDFYVRTTVNPQNFGEIGDMARNIFEKYEHAISFHIEPVQYTGRGTDAQRSSELSNKILIQEYIKTKKEILSKYPNRSFYCSFFNYKDISIWCGSMAGKSPVINNKGYLFPCSDKLDTETQSMGLIEGGKVNIKRGSYYEDIYQKMLKTKCGNCPFFSLCAGGCLSTFKRNEAGELLPEGEAACNLLVSYWENAFSELAMNKEFLGLQLIEKAKMKNWCIYDIIDNNV